MAWTTALAIYFIIWWVVLFAVLPFGVRNAGEAGLEVEPGHDPGAPTIPALKTKLVWTTMVLRPLCSGVHSARAVSPSGIEAKKLVLLSIVVVLSPSLRLATVATAPIVSAKAM